ncbi:MAG: cache domain-containing protein [Candidatus Saccharibacteria bacterium]
MKRFKGISIQAKLLIGLGLTIAILPSFLFGFGFYYTQSLEAGKLESSNIEKTNLVNVLIDNDKKMLSSNLEIIASRDTLKQQFKARDREALYENANTFFEKLNQQNNITHLYFIEPDGTVFLRVHDKNRYGDIVTRATFRQASTTGTKVAGIELGKTGFALRTVMPFKDGDELLGYVEIGEEINETLFTMKSKTGSEFEALGKKQYLNEKDWNTLKGNIKIDENWGDFDNYATVAETNGTEVLNQCLSRSMNFDIGNAINYKRITDGGRTLVCSSIPMMTLGDVVIGELVYANDTTDIVNSTTGSYQIIFIVSIVSFFVLLSGTYYFLRRNLFKPLKSLGAAVDDITRTGDLEKNVPDESKDELGSLGRSFNALKDKLKKSQDEMESKVETRTDDLQVLNSSMIGRELKMIELKKQITELENKTVKKSDPGKVTIK